MSVILQFVNDLNRIGQHLSTIDPSARFKDEIGKVGYAQSTFNQTTDTHIQLSDSITFFDTIFLEIGAK